MKKEDFELLEKMLDGTIFEIVGESLEDNDKHWVVKRKNMWDGVEFVESGIDGMILPIKEISDNVIFTRDRLIAKNTGKPSTQHAYEEQLKRITREKFGEIKNQDTFDLSVIGYSNNCVISLIDGESFLDFTYNKKNDEFSLCGFPLYKQGKWAERVGRRIEVSVSGFNLKHYDKHESFESNFLIYNLVDKKFNPDLISTFLAKELENYLNDEKGN